MREATSVSGASSLPGVPAPTRPGSGPATLREALAFFVRHASPRILIAALSMTLVARVSVGGFTLWDGVPMLGLLLYWPLNEWLIHVFILHSKPFSIAGRWFDPAVPRKHRAHHRDPWNLEILFIPLQSFLYTLPLLFALCFVLAPTPGLALTTLGTYLALALRYEWIHFVSHTLYSPRLPHVQRVVRHHRWHHFKNEHYWYGVSMTVADRLLGTSPGPEDVERSETCRTLGVEK